MAIFHFSVKVISRASGRSAVAAAAYRSAEQLHDERLDRAHNFTDKTGVVHSEILAPDGAPEHLSNRERLWNEVEASEQRKDAQLAREVEFALPREMTQAQGIALARDFVGQEFVARGMIADLNVHWDIGKDGMAKPHAHVMLTMRQVGEDGFGAKVRDWNRVELVEQWRERWAEHVNVRLAELDIDARIDHRSLQDQGIALEPQDKIGPAAARMGDRGLESERIEDHRAIAQRNGARIIENPRVALDAITHHQATFTRRDLAMFVHSHSDGKDQYDAAISAVRNSPDMIALGKDGRGEERFTSRDMIETEQRLQRAAEIMAERERHRVGEQHRDAALARAERSGLLLSGEQRSAFDHITDKAGMSIVIGYAGTGKSAMLGVAREAWESAGFTVRGAALAGIAAEGLENGSGIASRTIASMEHGWAQERDLLTSRDVLVIDEAGMVGTRQMERVLSHAAEAGAKVVLVGDPQQLQSIEAGAAFRALHERHGGVEITQVRRQQQDWQRDATRHLATGRIGMAVAAYADKGMVHEAETRDDARRDLVARWDRERQADPAANRIILTHTNAEVRELNDAARGRMREAGALGDDVQVKVERGDRQFASGDRVMFLRNERSLDVKNGTLGTIEQVKDNHMAVRTDDGRSVAFDTKDYRDLDHGYAATIHKAQGMTVTHAHVLATPGMDRHGAYVALSRHQTSMALHYGRDDFKDQSKLVRTLSRERAKDMASDYQKRDPAKDYAERRGITFGERVAEIVNKLPEKARGMFDGLRFPTVMRVQAKDAQPDLRRLDVRGDERRAVERYARAWIAIERLQGQGFAALPQQHEALERSGKALDAIRPNGVSDLTAAFQRDPDLARKTADSGGNDALRAIEREAQVRVDPFLRSERFVEGWHQLQRDRAELVRDGDLRAARKAEAKMVQMARGLERDRTVAAILLTGGQVNMDEVRTMARGDWQTREQGAERQARAKERGRGLER